MTLLQLANLFNISAISAFVLVYAFVARRHPASFFRRWGIAFTCMLGVSAVELVASFVGHSNGLTILEVGLALVGSIQQLMASYDLGDRKPPVTRLWALATVGSGAAALLLLLGLPRALAVIPSILFLTLAMVTLGVSFIQHARRTLGPGVAWFGTPQVLMGLWMLAYPAIADTELYWLGFVVSAHLNILMGIGMMVLLWEDSALKVRHQHRILAENERLQQEMIARLQEVDRLKGDFINAASHELRTPLTSILGYSEFLEDGIGGPLSPDQVTFVDQIREGAVRLRRIVDDLLDFARLEAGTFALVPQDADIADLVRRELASLRPQAVAARIRLVEDLPEAPVTLRMDPRRIGQVVLNLVGNAIKFTRPDGSITVRVRPAGDGCRVEVSDTGIGISPEHQHRLFEKFFQVDPSTTRERGGAGLGLSICKALVEAHGGELGVHSTPGEGSTFWFTLPARALVPHG